jgi:hypothetical protein
MKKIVFILCTLALITACENEPLDAGFTEQNGGDDGNNGGNNGSESGDLTLELYELDTDLTFSFFGIPFNSVTNSDLNISENKIQTSATAVSIENSPFQTENQTYTRNNAGQITSDISVNAEGVTTNEYIISYANGMISQITYDYFEDDDDDYTYNFTYDGNTIIRTEVGSSISTVFTIDGFDRIIKKESFDDTFSIQTETMTYNGGGNINSSITTGETESNVTYNFDDNTNPLQVVYNDNYLLNFLADDYSDEVGPLIAQFHSTNNWNGATFDGETFTFDLEYNSMNRLTNRDIIYDFGAEFMVEINERFTYVN